MVLSDTALAWLIVLAAMLTLIAGALSRVLIGRYRESRPVLHSMYKIRGTAIGRLLFGPFDSDALDDDELDQVILMPTLVVACGLLFTSFFLFGLRMLI